MKFDGSFIFPGVLLALLFFLGQSALGGGAYQHTRDGKIIVWNGSPEPGDQAVWSGQRDSAGYATGAGTLTWYRARRLIVTGSNIPTSRGDLVVFGRYTGSMVDGKLDGIVKLEVKDKIFHATFASGERTDDWSPGPAPTPKPRRPHTKTAAAATPQPVATPVVLQPASSGAVIEAPTQSNDSLRSLTAPPSVLRKEAPPTAALQIAKASAAPAPSIADKPVSAEIAPALKPEPIASPRPSAVPAATPAPTPDDAHMVATLDQEYQAAVKTNDAAAMDRILADDFVLVTGRGRVLKKNDLLAAAREKQTVYERQEEEAGTQKVRIWGDTAVVTALLWIKGKENGKSLDDKLWFSDTYVRTPAGWRYVFGQASMPAPKADAK